MDEIQGNVIPGFNKDHVKLLFLRIEGHAAAKRWIDKVASSIATAQEVWQFKRQSKLAGKRAGHKGTAESRAWINIAFSYKGLRRLLPTEADKFVDDAFRRSTERAEADWTIGGEETDPDIVLIIAADKARDVDVETKRVKNEIRAGPTAGGVRVICEERGAAPGDMRGREHFGWRDGISQPGVRGWLSAERRALFTPRTDYYGRPNQGLPGQDVLWPGEFVFGYSRQDRNDAVAEGPNSLEPDGRFVAPKWAKYGSYLVFRRLSQDVGAFHRFLFDEGEKLGVDPEALGARLVGRWPSGAPLVRTPVKDKPGLGRKKDKNNDFEFGVDDDDREGSAVPRDPAGLYCPFSAHIRKAYPRDETVTPGDPNPYGGLGRALNGSDTQTHRLLRRGIPYGPPSESTPRDPIDDDVDRGLLFIAYMTSISDQFEFVEKYMFNSAGFKRPETGVDPIVGEAQGGRRNISTVLPDEVAARELELGRWVTTTGGAYFFAPSISGLREIAT